MPTSGAAAAAGMTSAEDASVTRHRRRHLRRFSNHPRERRRTHHHPSQLSTGDAVDTRSQQQQHHSGDDGARRHRRPTQLRQPSSPHLSQSYASGNMQINATSLTSGPATSTTTPTPANAAAAGGGSGAPNTARAPSRPRDGHRSFRRSIYTNTPPRQRPTSTHAPANINNNNNNNNNSSGNNNNSSSGNNNNSSSGNTTSSIAHPPALPSTLRFRREDGGGYVLASDAHGATAMGTAIMRSTQQLPLSASLLEVALPRLPPTSWMDEDDDECTNEVGEDGGAMIQTPTNVFTQRSRGSGRPSAATSRSPLAANKSQSHNAIVGLNTRIQEQEELVMYLSSSAVTVPSSPTSPRRLLSPTSVLHVLPSSPQPQLHQRPLSPMPNADGVGGDVLTAATNTSGAAYNLALATVSSLRSGSSEESLTDDDDSSSERSADDGVEEMGSSSILSALEEGGGIIFSDSYLRLHPESALTTRCHRLSAHTASLHNSPRPLRSEGRSLSPHPANFRSGRSRLTSPTIATTADNVAPTRWEAGSSAEPSSPSTHFLAYPSSPSTPQYQQQQQQLFASPRGVGSGAATITLGRSVAAAGRSSSRFTSQISAPFSPTDPNNNNNNNSFSTILPMMMDAVVLEVYDSTINNANGGRRRHRDRRRLPSRPVPTPQHTSPRPSMAGGVQADLKHAAEYLVDVAQNQRPMFRRKTSAEAYGRGTYFQPVDVNVPRSLMQDPLKQTRRPSDPLAGMGTMRDDGEGMLSDTSGTCMSIASPSRTLGPPPQMQPANFDSSIMHGSEWINQ